MQTQMSKIVKLKITSARKEYCRLSTINYFCMAHTRRMRNIFQHLSHYVYAISRRVAGIYHILTKNLHSKIN